MAWNQFWDGLWYNDVTGQTSDVNPEAAPVAWGTPAAAAPAAPKPIALGTPATAPASNWWDNLAGYQGDASGIGSQQSITNPNTGKAESLVAATQVTNGVAGKQQLIPWSEFQRLKTTDPSWQATMLHAPGTDMVNPGLVGQLTDAIKATALPTLAMALPALAPLLSAGAGAGAGASAATAGGSLLPAALADALQTSALLGTGGPIASGVSLPGLGAIASNAASAGSAGSAAAAPVAAPVAAPSGVTVSPYVDVGSPTVSAVAPAGTAANPFPNFNPVSALPSISTPSVPQTPATPAAAPAAAPAPAAAAPSIPTPPTANQGFGPDASPVPGATDAVASGSSTPAVTGAVASDSAQFGTGATGSGAATGTDIAGTSALSTLSPSILNALGQAMGIPNLASWLPLLQSGIGIAGGLNTIFGANANQGDPSTLFNAGNTLWNTAQDPQSALYNRTLQQTQDLSRAATSARGIGMSPVAAGIENDATRNFNIDWQNAQLARQATGADTLANTYRAGTGQQTAQTNQSAAGTNALLTGLQGLATPGATPDLSWLSSIFSPSSAVTPSTGYYNPTPTLAATNV